MIANKDKQNRILNNRSFSMQQQLLFVVILIINLLWRINSVYMEIWWKDYHSFCTSNDHNCCYLFFFADKEADKEACLRSTTQYSSAIIDLTFSFEAAVTLTACLAMTLIRTALIRYIVEVTTKRQNRILVLENELLEQRKWVYIRQISFEKSKRSLV